MPPPSLNADCQTLADACPGLSRHGPNRTIAGLSADSRAIRPGFLFAALPGVQTDGRRYISQALAAGAVAILDAGGPLDGELPADVARLCHPDPRLALSHLAAAFYGHPARRMRMVAITGTNGKTSVAAMIESILGSRGERVGVIGTTGIRHPGIRKPNPLTTPDPVLLQSTLRQMVDNRCDTAVVEVSSHAMSQRRTAGTPWAVALFTNLSRDHLDYHPSLEDYFAAKARLFLEDPVAAAVINGGDAWGQQLLERLHRERPDLPTTLFGATPGGPRDRFVADAIALGWEQTRFVMGTPGESIPVSIPGAGRFNVENALAAAAACWQLGAREREIARGLGRFRPPAGRMQTIHVGQPFAVVVDFAHTPDALERLLTTARELTPDGRLITVFGCGGNRDTGKRRLMGQIASRLGELAIVTDDNPRDEDPSAIRRTVLTGCLESGGRCLEIPDREEAIIHALEAAYPGDAVLIVGKGHERFQITAGQNRPFDDAEIAREYLER